MKFARISPLPRLVALLATASLTSGCGMFGDTTDDYYRAQPLPPMKVPEGMQTTSLEPLYVVPELSNREDELRLVRGDSGYEAPRPEPLPTRGATESGVKIQRLAEERWILVDAPTSQIWPRVQSFLSRYGIGVDVNNPAGGLIETGWVRFTVDDELKHRYRIWIERGLRPETTEVHVVHRQVPEAFNDVSAIEWQRESENKERENYLLDELAAALAADARNSSASLLGQSVGGESKSDIVFVDKEPVLRLRLSYERTWATVKHSLEQEFVLWESDPAKGVFLVGYLLDDPQDDSFLKRWFFSSELPEEAPAKVADLLRSLSPAPDVQELFADIPETAYESAEPISDAYLVVVKATSEGSSVYVRATDGTRLAPRDARKILTTIRRNLI